MRWIQYRTVSLAVLAACVACGTEPEGGVPGSNGFVARFDVVADFERACQSKCAAIDSDGARCASYTMTTCIDGCLSAVENTDRKCAECVVQTMAWSDGYFTCNDWECSCTLRSTLSGSPHLCPDVCEASLDYQLALREAVQGLESVGPAPGRVVEREGRGVGSAEIEGSPAGQPDGLFELQRDDGVLRALNSIGEVLWSVELSAMLGASDLWVSGEEALVASGGSGGVWQRVDGAGRLSEVTMPEERYKPHWLTPGGVFVDLDWNAQGAVIRRVSVAGEVLDVLQVPDVIVSRVNSRLERVLERADGTFLLAYQYGEEVPRRQGLAQLLRGAEGGGLEVGWELDLPLQPTEFTLSAQDGLLCAGVEQSVIRGQRDRPAMVRVSPEGGLDWQWVWEPALRAVPDRAPLEAVGLTGVIAVERFRLFARADGGAVLVTTESPAGNYAGLGTFSATPSPQEALWVEGICPVYGCSRLVVRWFSAEGQLLSTYEHRADTSVVDDATMVGDSLYVLTTLYGETPRQVLMVFEP